VWTIDVRSIEKVDAQFERAIDGGKGFLVIAVAIELTHAHAAKANG